MRLIKQRAEADHGRAVTVYGPRDMPPGGRVGIFVRLAGREAARTYRGGQAAVAWVGRTELRKLRRAIDRALGSGR